MDWGKFLHHPTDAKFGSWPGPCPELFVLFVNSGFSAELCCELLLSSSPVLTDIPDGFDTLVQPLTSKRSLIIRTTTQRKYTRPDTSNTKSFRFSGITWTDSRSWQEPLHVGPNDLSEEEQLNSTGTDTASFSEVLTEAGSGGAWLKNVSLSCPTHRKCLSSLCESAWMKSASPVYRLLLGAEKLRWSTLASQLNKQRADGFQKCCGALFGVRG